MNRRPMRRPMPRDHYDSYNNRQMPRRESRYPVDRSREGRYETPHRSEYRDEYYDDYDDRYDDDYDDHDEQEYVQDLEDWIAHLKATVKVDVNYDNIIKAAKEMAIKFRDFTELEFYATYLMEASDFPYISGDPRIFIQMARSFLEDDDISVTPSEKLCIYLYKIVKGM